VTASIPATPNNNMHNGHSKNFNVAIVGGGMGGLALAVSLTRGGVKVDIFEQAVIVCKKPYSLYDIKIARPA
jgi:flavin-dependent dehydrogenase